MTKLIVAMCFIAVAACSEAAPAPATTPSSPSPPDHPACDASGDVLFEVDHELGTDPVTPQSADILYASGGWRSTDTKGKNTTGCMMDAELATARRDVESSPWTSVPNSGASCGAITLEHTVYKARGKVVWVNAGCSPNHLDEVSAKNLDELGKLVATVTSRPAAQPR
jgi:hypothetical protein